MNTRKLLASILLVATVWLPVHAVDPPSASKEESYEAYLKRRQEMYDAYQRDGRITAGVLLAVVGGLVAFVILPASRRTRRAFELAEQQQKTLEEIRDLLKKP